MTKKELLERLTNDINDLWHTATDEQQDTLLEVLAILEREEQGA